VLISLLGMKIVCFQYMDELMQCELIAFSYYLIVVEIRPSYIFSPSYATGLVIMLILCTGLCLQFNSSFMTWCADFWTSGALVLSFFLRIYYHVGIYRSCISTILVFFFALQSIGIVGAITPWNFPWAMITRKVSSHAVHFSSDKNVKNEIWCLRYYICTHGFWAGWASFGM
jgi:hypothetical protein